MWEVSTLLLLIHFQIVLIRARNKEQICYRRVECVFIALVQNFYRNSMQSNAIHYSQFDNQQHRIISNE